ncbi:MAG: hypothetical protein IPI53_02360 [Saprospiraceae bacterium]|nr:hypothetical protein [Saprospiraceae bacterium]MBK8370586.1 hypothetical protein [Saprospiraceae bacterium]MBK9044482.1 hypothetical protein [Saprospiraceae bacterium]MBP6695006.1 hypothetical protein [Saprospiraceae bacterium]
MASISSPYTVIVFCRFEGFFSKLLALMAMAIIPLTTKKAGYLFFKLMGSGGGLGFDIKPDFARYSYLSIWDSEQDFVQCLRTNRVFELYHFLAKEIEVYHLQPKQVHGTWGGKQPFTVLDTENDGNQLAVITRATIKWKNILTFHKHVPEVSRLVSEAPGHILSVGIGEWPFRFQATFSIWKTMKDMENYAYKNVAHVNMITKTRSIGWYKEEMFARFIVLKKWTLKGSPRII